MSYQFPPTDSNGYFNPELTLSELDSTGGDAIKLGGVGIWSPAQSGERVGVHSVAPTDGAPAISSVALMTNPPAASSRTGPYSGAAAKNVPIFLNKLFNMVSEPSTNQYIRWTDEGNSFIVADVEGFAQNILPLYFKHNNFTSFVRQLNMYRFHKVPHLQHGTMRTDKRQELWEFSNSHFVRGRPDRLCFVQRKKSREEDEKEDSSDASKILHELDALRKHQITISEEFKVLQKNNELLWREAMQMREKHDQQQKYISNIIQFFHSKLFQSKVGRYPGAGKELSSQENRKPLMIEASTSLAAPEGVAPSSPLDIDQQKQVDASRASSSHIEELPPSMISGHGPNIDDILQPNLFHFPADANSVSDFESMLMQPSDEASAKEIRPPAHKRHIYETTFADEAYNDDNLMTELVGIVPPSTLPTTSSSVNAGEAQQADASALNLGWPAFLNEYPEF